MWDMSNSGYVSIEIYNLNGQLVDLLLNENLVSGYHQVAWNALGYPSGIYFYRLTFNEVILQKKMILLR